MAVYEADGQYAGASFDSPYCAFLDRASRRLAGGGGRAEMMASGRWHCHESCWTEASRVTVETGEPFDLQGCRGGLNIYAAPVVAEGQVIGSINFGYGTPPRAGPALGEVARLYQVDPTELAERARSVPELPAAVLHAAKGHLRVLADQLAELYLRRVAETRLRDSEALLNQTQHLAGAGGWVWDVAAQQGYWTAETFRIHGLEPPQAPVPITGSEVDLSLRCYGPEMRRQVAAAFERCQHSGESYDIEGAFTARDGQERWVRTTGQAVVEGGRVVRVLGTLVDITERQRQQRQLEHLVRYDALTDLPNRVLLADRLHQGIAQARRRGNRLGVGYLDLDGFKAVNDRHGRDAGDRFLAALAQRMRGILREGDTLARMGGDEFAAVLVDLEDNEASLPLVRRLLASAASPVVVGDSELRVSASLGIRLYPMAGEGEVDPDQLLRQADQAMYQAKLAGKNRYHVFDAARDRSIRSFHERLEEIRAGLARGEFTLFYQPKVNLRSGELVGAEALVRWRHPEQGLLPPSEFLPVVEGDPLSVALGEWVIGAALDQVGRWCQAGLHIPVSVNVGALHLQQQDFLARLAALLAGHPEVPPDHLWLEVVETSALEDMAHVSEVLQGAWELGVRFSLDDFGTGYSSLRYLRHLPVAELKIDQSFVRDMLEDPEDLAILEGVLGMAAAFRRQVIAEGVETEEHGRLLVQLGCDLAQGYAIARPMEADSLPEWLARWRPEPAWTAERRALNQDLPLVFAGVEHRAWHRELEDYARGRLDAPPPLDHRACRLGSWLEREGRERYGGHRGYPRVAALHRQVHARAGDLPRLREGADPDALEACLREVQALRHQLLQALDEMAGRVPSGGGDEA